MVDSFEKRIDIKLAWQKEFKYKNYIEIILYKIIKKKQKNLLV